MKMEALGRQGKRNDLTCGQVGHKLRERISEQDSGRQVQRFIRLTYLIPELLEMVDEKRIAMSPAVELSYLSDEAQYAVLDAIEINACTPSHAQAIRMKSLFSEGKLSVDAIEEIMEEVKPNQKEKIKLNREDFSRYFPSRYTNEQIKKDIVDGLELLKRKRQRDMDAR